ncbi:MAG: flavodoxin family protein [Spirochaetaceae bacterium]|jgi:multimeric flavodoxin WrbA|nr:flavodoxin family protein [Spirochaetaceae bacterium]
MDDGKDVKDAGLDGNAGMVIAINGSPRKNANTAALLQNALDGAASAGAETELIHLVDLQYRGCMSCFACKRKGTKFIGSCALQDDLTPVLEKVMQSRAVILGSPIYLADVTSLMRAFIERFGFMNISYDNKGQSSLTRKINGAFFYTMNVPKLASALFTYVYKFNTGLLKRCLRGKVEQLICADTWQFDDYDKYAASRFDVAKKKKARELVFPKDCEKAYLIGKRLSGSPL